jgi:hypothetical protein
MDCETTTGPWRFQAYLDTLALRGVLVAVLGYHVELAQLEHTHAGRTCATLYSATLMGIGMRYSCTSTILPDFLKSYIPHITLYVTECQGYVRDMSQLFGLIPRVATAVHDSENSLLCPPQKSAHSIRGSHTIGSIQPFS